MSSLDMPTDAEQAVIQYRGINNYLETPPPLKENSSFSTKSRFIFTHFEPILVTFFQNTKIPKKWALRVSLSIFFTRFGEIFLT